MGGVLTDIMTITTDNDYSLARDLIGLALADGVAVNKLKLPFPPLEKRRKIIWSR